VGTGAYPSRATLTFTPAAGTLTVTVSGTVEYANLEIGAGGLGASFPTSYIPTEGSTVTRAADVASISGSNFSSWFNVGEGSVFASYDRTVLTSDAIRIFEFENGSDRYELISDAAVRTRTAIGGVNTNIGSFAQEQSGKYGAAYKASNYAGSYNGGTASTVTSVTSTVNANEVALGSSGTSLYINGHLKRFTYWPVRLENNVLQAITQ
jgi:hypothetical protein